MTAVDIIGCVGAIFGLIAAAVAGWIILKSRVATTTADLWKGEAEAQKERSDRLEKTVSELVARVEHLESENKTLRELATSSNAVAALSSKVDANHAQIMEALHAR